MTFSILFERPEDSIKTDAADLPAFFDTLHLDQRISGKFLYAHV